MVGGQHAGPLTEKTPLVIVHTHWLFKPTEGIHAWGRTRSKLEGPFVNPYEGTAGELL